MNDLALSDGDDVPVEITTDLRDFVLRIGDGGGYDPGRARLDGREHRV